MFAIIGVIISVSLAPGPGMIQGWLKRWKCFLSKCGMSFLMLFKGELVTDPGRGLLCVIMGSGQGTPVPQSSTPSLFSWRLGRGVRRGECPNVHRGTGTGIQRTEDTKTQKKNIDKLDFAKIKTFVIQRTPSRKWKSNPQIGRKYVVNYIYIW